VRKLSFGCCANWEAREREIWMWRFTVLYVAEGGGCGGGRGQLRVGVFLLAIILIV
jgi:hypothetical protein